MSSEEEIIKITSDSLSLVNEIFQLGSTFADVSKIVTMSRVLGQAIPVLGAVLVLIEGLLPDRKHEEILRGFQQLSNKIDHVRNDLKDLEKMIKWEFTELQFADHVGVIELGMQYWFEIANATEADKITQQGRLMDLCGQEKCTLALKSIMGGVNGNGFFKKSILDTFYNKTGGNRAEISGLATRLLQLGYGGMLVISSYEAMVRGGKASEYVTKIFARQLIDASDKVQSVLTKCMNNFREHMSTDLNTTLDKGGSNVALFTELSELMTRKYDWLENFCLVYNDLQGYDKHFIKGHYVASLHRNEKCGVVFYRMKDKPPRFSNRYDEAHKIVQGVEFFGVEPAMNGIVERTKAKGIGWSGCAVIIRYPDLRFGGSFSTQTIFVVGRYHTAILLLE